MRYVTAIAVCLFSSMLAGAAPTTQPLTAPPAVGDTAPDFALTTLNGKTIQLTDLVKTGPVVVLELRGWVGYQCPLCNRQVGDFLGKADAFHKAGARVVLVYPGPADGLRAHAQDFIAGKGLPQGFSFISDPDLNFVTAWGLRWDAVNETAYPSTFVIDTAGVVRFSKVSHSHGDRATAKQALEAIAHLK